MPPKPLLRLWIGGSLIGLGACAPHDPPPREPGDGGPFAVLNGLWDWEGVEGFCKENPFTLQSSRDRTTVVLTSARPRVGESGEEPGVSVYRVLGHGPRTVRGMIKGETRLTAEGRPIVWDFVLLERDRFCWRRTDWAADSCTRPLVRCATSAATVALSLPPVLGEFTLDDSTRYADASAGVGYVYRSAPGVYTNVYVYPIPPDHRALSAERAVEAEAAEFLAAMPEMRSRGYFERYEVVANRPEVFETSRGPRPGYLVSFTFRSEGQVFVSFMHLVAYDDDTYVKTRLSLPERGWRTSTAPDFALHLFRAMGSP